MILVSLIMLALAGAPAAQRPAATRLAGGCCSTRTTRIPIEGRWSDRIDRALATGLPVAIEQDLMWRPATGHVGSFDRFARRAVHRRRADAARFLRTHPPGRRLQALASGRANSGRSSRSTSISRTAIHSISPPLELLGEYQSG